MRKAGRRASVTPKCHRGWPLLLRRYTVETCGHACDGSALFAMSTTTVARSLGGLCACSHPNVTARELKIFSLSDFECAWPCRGENGEDAERPCGSKNARAVYCRPRKDATCGS